MATTHKELKGTMDMFLSLALRRILKEATKKHAHLRESCSSTLELVNNFGVTPKSNKREHIEQADKVINKLIITLKLACESRQAKIMSNALDCLQKLMAYGYIRPSIRDIENPESKLMDKVIVIIGDCFDFNDDDVQLQILKAFLTAVSSTHCDVHDRALVNAIRACFNIYLVSRNRSNQTMAKGTLTQMLGIIFQRFEQAVAFAQEEKDRASREGFETVEIASENDKDIDDIPKKMEEIFMEAISNDKSEEEEEEIADDDPLPAEKSVEDSARSIVNTIIDNAIPDGLDVVPENSEEDTEASAVEQVIQETLEMAPQGQSIHVATGQAAVNIAYNDCSGIFKALCKLSSKELPASTSADSVDMRRKLLALQLIESIIEGAGPNLQTNERFVNNAIKKYLFISLLLNGVSPFIKVFRTSLSIFHGLLGKFQVNLRNEIGVYFSKIILRILASSNSSTQHKHVILLLLLKICKEAQILVDIFLNFDCHMDSVDIFERIVTELSGIAKGTHIASGAPLTQQEVSVRLLGLECLVTIMRSLVFWSNDLVEQLENESGSPNSSDAQSQENGKDSPLISKEDFATSKTPISLDKFTQQKQWKQQVEHGKKLFNYKPKKGVAFLTEIGHIPNTSKGVAAFLLHTEGLDRAKIGDYIGDISNPFCKSILYDYIDIQRFNDMEIYAALRKFLLGFRLPGEGQKIDVIMEKFAERYYNDNKKEGDDFLFANADAVYIFAYHMIMLATDLHSHAIKKKITKQEWIKNNTGLNDGKDFSEKFLLGIYDSVTEHRLRVRDDDDSSSVRVASDEFLSPKQRQMLFHKESETIVQRSQELIQDQLQKKSTFFKSTNIQHVKPMFAMCWCPMLAALSMNLETSQDTDREVYTLCLDGFQCGIRVSSIFFMETERNAFVSSLSQFTLLSNLREMKQKNIEAIKCLIQIANTDGNYLQDSWTQVLKCISQLAKIHILGSTRVSSDTTQQVMIQNEMRNRRQDSSGTISIRTYETLNATSVAEQINVDEIDKIFSNTVQLNDNAIVFFVKCLCWVSAAEVESPEPRTFSLQKLIEIAYYNMTRIRFVWTRIWGIMADHFKKVGVHKNNQISMYAVDSLRQLAMKFLEKDELANYHFQKDFLKPFEFIISNNRSLAVRELVVRCLTQMILARGKNIKSGWKSIFIVFTSAAGESDESIVSLAYEITQKILDDYFELISPVFFVECVNCIVGFAKNKHFKEIGCQAVDSLNICAAHLAEGRVFDISPGDDEIAFTDNEHDMKFWFPILTGLSEVISHPHVDVRKNSLDILFEMLFKYGNLFSAGLWELVFRGVLFPIFDNVRHAGDGSWLKEDNEWLTSTCLNALSLFVKLFSHFFENVNFLLNDCLALLTSCILQENQHLASIGATCFLQLVMMNGTKWTSEMWGTICFTIQYIITRNRSIELLTFVQPTPTPTRSQTNDEVLTKSSNDSKSESSTEHKEDERKPIETIEQKLIHATPPKYFPYDVHVITGKSNVLLQLLETTKDILVNHLNSLKIEHLEVVLNTLQEAYNFAYEVNNKKEVWKATGKSTIMQLVIRHESLSASILLEILFQLYASENNERVVFAENTLIGFTEKILRDYQTLTASTPAAYSLSKVPIMLQIISGVEKLSDDQFLKHLARYFQVISGLIVVPNKDIRISTRRVFLRIGRLHQFSSSAPELQK